MLKGIDVSAYQGAIDWYAVKEAGIDFTVIKASQGRAVTSDARLFADRRFAENIAGASGAGLRCGVYHYLTAQSTDEARAEADFFTAAIAPYRENIALWAAADVEEDKYLPGDREQLTAVVDAFCSRVAEAGYRPMVYTNPNYLKNRLGDVSQWELWLALWRDSSRVPYGYANMRIWQWGESNVGGVSGGVDSNLGFFDIETALDNDNEESGASETINENISENVGADTSVNANVDASINASVDASRPSEWAEEAVGWAVENGILFGDGNGGYGLRESCTREQMLVFLHRLYKLLMSAS